jgi:hypothetical protein
MSEFKTPAGRLVQGMLVMQQRKDITTKQPVWKDPAKTIPDMGTFFSLAFPKSIAGGAPTYTVRADLAAQGHTMQSLAAHGTPAQLVQMGYLIASDGGNPEWDTFNKKLKEAAATAWPAFFPQGGTGACTNPKFSWKIQDGDGFDHMGVSVATKPGFAGHWIVKFDTNFPIKVYNEGHFAPHEELQQPEKIVKRGYWVRVYGELKSNMATGTQVPGIVLYPNLVSFLGGRREDEIISGPDAQQALGGQGAFAGWRPDGISTVPGAPVGLPAPGGLPLPTPGAGLPLPPASIAAPVAPQYQVRADLAAQGHTMQSLAAHGMPEQLVAAGYLTVMTPAPAPLPAPGLPAPGGLPLPTPGGLPAPGGLPLPPAALVPAAPQYALIPGLVAQGVTIEALIAKGWTPDALVQAGHATKIG